MLTNEEKIGAVLVIGGGIAGMQAALDCANSGLKVYLVEKEASIGGTMPMLDKTFPTNDCAMCMLAPKLVDTGRHPNIKTITLAEVQSLEGEAGRFKVAIKKRARYVDEEKCNGCGDCAEKCPVEVLSEFDQGLAKRKAIYKRFPQANPNIFAISKNERAPCGLACPAGTNVQGYVALISQGKFAEALELIRERITIPAVCGRVCHHPCEDNCNRNEVDEPVAIKYLKRFVADYVRQHPEELERVRNNSPKEFSEKELQLAEKRKGKPVAIVGSGPAGLTVAYDLAKLGYKTTVFEALPVAGGMLRIGVPQYRLPKEVLDYEIGMIKKAGVEIRLNTPIGPDLTLKDLFKMGYKAIFIAIGTHKARRLNIEGEDLEGVIHGVRFLRSVVSGKKVDLNEKVVAVIGGGNVAIDSVRTALRLGAKEAFIIYRRSKEEFPASEEELLGAEQEGIRIHYLAAPTKIIGEEGKVVGVECVRMKLGEKDETGRRRPIPDESSKFTIAADVVIPAIGQASDLEILSEDIKGLQVTKEGALPIEGMDLDGVHGFTAFLRAASTGGKVDIGKRVIVIGGGNVAIDVARTAVRLGVEEVRMVCLEARWEMPADEDEIKAALEEGVILQTSLAPKRIVGKDGKAVGLETLECISVFDSDGRFNPKFKEGTESIIPAETIIVAIGQEADYSLLKAADGVLVTTRGRLQVDETTFATNVEGIFAGGDVIGGPGLAVHAIAHAHEAAISIDRYLLGQDLKKGREKAEIPGAKLPERKIEPKKRQEMPIISLERRTGSFEEIEIGFSKEQAIEEAKRCLNCGICSECMQCVKACGQEAIDHQMQDQHLEIEVGAVIIALGFESFDPKKKSEYGYGRYPNVLTTIEFERILSASGPSQGHVFRPSDHKVPKRIAWLQCVGSRDPACGNDYCSSVCCMYATKEAIIAKEHIGDVDCHIFYMDMRSFGKDFEKYYQRAIKDSGVKYIRARVPAIEEIPETQNLRIRYENEEGELVEEEYDLVVLSSGLVPSKEIEELKEILGIEINSHGFIKTDEFSPAETSREGIYVCGVCSEPKDIPETVTQASAAAAKASSLLASVRGTQIEKKVYPEELEVAAQEPRIGVFICQCGINIGGVVDVPQVVEYAQSLPYVVYAEHNLFTCSQDTQQRIREKIKECRLNRVVVASCTPRTHEPLFQDTIRAEGLNPYLFEMANIRDQCSWVHRQLPTAATEKAKELVAMTVAKAKLLKPVKLESIPLIRKGLVVGGGLAGMTAALSLAKQGFEVYLIEKEAGLGGHLREIYYTLDGSDPQTLLKKTISEVLEHKRIHVYTNAKIRAVSGYVGNYTTVIDTNKKEEGIHLEHGITIIATGAEAYQPKEYLYGRDERIMTQHELENRVATDDSQFSSLKTVVMIQCVGSRDEERPYCSRVCCSQAIKNAIKLKEVNPSVDIFVLYRDIRTYGFKERYYRQAREIGAIFVRYDPENKPKVFLEDGVLGVTFREPLLGERLTLQTDLIVLSAGIVPRRNKDLAKLFKLPVTADGFFLEAHAKLRPVDFAADGIFLCGLAHSPRCISEIIAQAEGAAARAATLLSQDHLQAKGIIVSAAERWCSGCGICVPVCPYDARVLDQQADVVRVLEVLCQGCGACAVACPNGATQQKNFEKKQILAMAEMI